MSAEREVRKPATYLFCDVAGSTQLVESLAGEAARAVMGRYFDAASAAVERHGGTVEKFIGDAVVAAFGLPVLREDDALRAVRAAADVRAAVDDLNGGLEADFGVRLAVRIGVNSGEVVAGSADRGHSFAIGSAVNLAARLQAAAEPGEILLGAATHRLVAHAVQVEPLPPLELAGLDNAVEAVRLVAVDPAAPARGAGKTALLVGREGELAEILDGFERVSRERRRRALTLVGDAGVGKSRLAAAAVERLPPGTRVLRGRCLHYGEGITYWPLREALAEAAGISDRKSVV